VTYRQLFASSEYRTLLAALVISYLGDQLAALAVSVLVFDRTGSTLFAAVAFASAYLPWMVGGPFLSPYADRLPRRRVLVGCDLGRAALFGLLAVPIMPVGALMSIMFAANLMAPPFVSARAALLPEILEGDLYSLGNGLNNVAQQTSLLFGFAAGGVLITWLSPTSALLMDAATFLVSAALLRFGLRERHSAIGVDARPSILADVWTAVRYVFTHRDVRAYVVIFWVTTTFTFAFEGLAYPYSVELGTGPVSAGLMLAAPALGAATAGLVLTRLVSPARRLHLVMPMAVMSCVVLIPTFVVSSVPAALLLFGLAGVGSAFTTVLNPLFVRAVPPDLRGRAMGIANAGNRTTDAIAAIVAGALAQNVASRSTVIALSGLLGTVAALGLTLIWPHRQTGP
jgi:MFS family permease